MCIHNTQILMYKYTWTQIHPHLHTIGASTNSVDTTNTHADISIIPSSSHSNTLTDTSSHKDMHSQCPSDIPSLTLIKPLYKTQVHLGIHKYIHSQSHRHRYTLTSPIASGHRPLHSTDQTLMKNTETLTRLCSSADILKYTRSAPKYIQGHTHRYSTHIFVCL